MEILKNVGGLISGMRHYSRTGANIKLQKKLLISISYYWNSM